jgi:hypothetical protein
MSFGKIYKIQGKEMEAALPTFSYRIKSEDFIYRYEEFADKIVKDARLRLYRASIKCAPVIESAGDEELTSKLAESNDGLELIDAYKDYTKKTSRANREFMKDKNNMKELFAFFFCNYENNINLEPESDDEKEELMIFREAVLEDFFTSSGKQEQKFQIC